MLKFVVLSSGSKANCIYIEVDGVEILLDCGLSYKQLRLRLGNINRNPERLKYVFISHSGHSDHYKGVKTLVKKHRHINVLGAGERLSNSMVHGKQVKIKDGVTVTAFALDHDVTCVGYRVEDSVGNALLYITDTGSIPCESLGYMLDAGAIVVESNHDTKMLNGCFYDEELKQRVAETHLENFQANELLSVLKNDKLKHVVLHHLSKNSNDPALALYEAGAGLGDMAKDINILCGCESHATSMMVLI